jgi:mannose-6-phosphate isomerase-like protein (cupin superfamily)
MLVRTLEECNTFTAGDKSLLKEILHPDRHDLNIRYSLAWATVKPGQKTLAHTLMCAEVYYIIRGHGRMHINKEEKAVQQNDTIYIPPHAVQFIENTTQEELVFLCIVDPAWRPEAEQILSNRS